MCRNRRQEVSDKILIVSPIFAPATVVGAARMTSLAGYLVKEGHSVTVLSAGKRFCKDDLWTRPIPEGVKLVEVEECENYIYAMKKKIEELMENIHFSVCLSSMGPFDAQKFLWKVCERNNMPLILDYRDLWLFYSYYYRNKPFMIKIKRLLLDIYSFPFEKANIRYASKIITVTEKNASIMKKRNKRYADKVCTIQNGHEDLSIFLQNNMREKRDAYTIGCAGKFLYYNESLAVTLIRALEELNEENINCKLFHIGEESDNAAFLVEDKRAKRDIYQYCGKKEYKDAMRFLAEQDACLIIYGIKEGLGTKVFDYVGLNKPIIYCGVLPSELGEFISRFQNVVVADNFKDIKEGIKKLVQRKIYQLEEKPLDFYSREKQNERYEKLIREVIDEGL